MEKPRLQSGEGSASFFLGPMFSGKTNAICSSFDRIRYGGADCLFIQHELDTRYGDRPGAYTHSGTSLHEEPAVESNGQTPRRGGLRVVRVGRLADVTLADCERYIGVDEGQFFEDLRPWLEARLVEGRNVFVAALDGDFRRNMFPPVAEALPLATSLVKLKAVCMYCTLKMNGPVEASYTVRTVAAEQDGPLVGASDKYKAACHTCYSIANKLNV